MTTPDKKAIEIMNGLYHTAMSSDEWHLYYKRCAKFLVDQIIDSDPLEPNNIKHADSISDYTDAAREYWEQVKKEIEKL